MKSPEERGPLGAWAYETRVILDLSPEAVVRRLPVPSSGRPYDPATLRKAEADSRHMSGPLWRALTALYPMIARERGVSIAPHPVDRRERAAPDPATDLAAAIRDLTAELAVIRREREAWAQGVVRLLSSAIGGQVPEELLDALVPRPPEDAPR